MQFHAEFQIHLHGYAFRIKAMKMIHLLSQDISMPTLPSWIIVTKGTIEYLYYYSHLSFTSYSTYQYNKYNRMSYKTFNNFYGQKTIAVVNKWKCSYNHSNLQITNGMLPSSWLSHYADKYACNKTTPFTVKKK